MFEGDLLNLREADAHFTRRAADDIDMHVGGGDTRDAVGHDFKLRRLDDQHQILLCTATHRAEERRKLRFDEATVEGELAALENLVLESADRVSGAGL
jgi:hypothetical protein